MTIWMPYTNLNPPANNLSHTVWYLPFLHLQKLPSLCDFSFHRMRNSRFVKISLAYYFSCLYIGILVSLLCWALLPFIIAMCPPAPIDQCCLTFFLRKGKIIRLGRIPCYGLFLGYELLLNGFTTGAFYWPAFQSIKESVGTRLERGIEREINLELQYCRLRTVVRESKGVIGKGTYF